MRESLTDHNELVYPPGPKQEKFYHESTKVRRHESLNVIIFRAFPGPDLAQRLSRLIRTRSARAGNLSCFRDCLLWFSASKTRVFH
jgi:hypothetical protein